MLSNHAEANGDIEVRAWYFDTILVFIIAMQVIGLSSKIFPVLLDLAIVLYLLALLLLNFFFFNHPSYLSGYLV